MYLTNVLAPRLAIMYQLDFRISTWIQSAKFAQRVREKFYAVTNGDDRDRQIVTRYTAGYPKRHNKR